MNKEIIQNLFKEAISTQLQSLKLFKEKGYSDHAKNVQTEINNNIESMKKWK